MTRQGEFLWYYDQTSNYVGKTTTGGSLRSNFIPNDNTIRGLTWDGTHIWTMNTSGEMKKFATSGALEDTFSHLFTSGWGLVYDGIFLWASDPGTDKIYQISLFDDDEPPGPPTIESTTHPFGSIWYSNANPVFTLNPPEDPSGIAGYSYLLDEHAETIPDSTIDGTGTTVGFVSIQDGAWYFHCRARDGAGNWGETNHYRIQIDTTPPGEGTILIDDDVDTTNSLIVTLSNLQAEDTFSGMGPGAAMKFSNDGFSWSDAEPFADTRADWDLSQYGGHDSTGLKSVFVSYQDVAGNWSEPFSDEIVFSAPLLMTTLSIDDGTLGFAYAETLSASGGWPPYQWEIGAGSLPPGLTLDPHGIISGVPDSDGTFNFTSRVTDAKNYSATMDFSITISVETVKGDVTGESDVNILDLIAVVRYILGLEEFTLLQLWAADVITDGTIDVTDVLGIVNIILESPSVTKVSSSSGQAVVGIEEDTRFSNSHNFYALTLKSPIPVAGIQMSIQVPPGTELTRPPQPTPWSEPFQINYRLGENSLTLLLYSLSHETIPCIDPTPIANLHFTQDAHPLHIHHVILSDKNGQPIPTRNSIEDQSSQQQWPNFQNHPNPFNSETSISFTLKKSGFITLAVYNILGQKVRTLLSRELYGGEHSVSWDGRDWTGNPLPSGVYFCRIEAGGIGAVREMLLLK